MNKGALVKEGKVLVHPAAAAPVVLKTAGLQMHYQMGKVIVEALRGVDLEIRGGEFVSIMGSSGSGKSTLLHIMGDSRRRPMDGFSSPGTI